MIIICYVLLISIFLVQTQGEEIPCPEGQNGQFSHPTYCDQYLDCWIGTSVVGQCEHGLVFNPNISSCDYPANVDCEGKLDSRPQADGSDVCPEPFGTFENPNHCGQFIICQGGSPTFFNCPPTLIYNSTLGVCVDGDSSCLPEPEAVMEVDPSNPTNETVQEAPDAPEEIPHPTEISHPDLNLDTIKPIKPSGPSANDSNSILFPVLPSWPRSPVGVILPMTRINCPVGYSVHYVSGTPSFSLCVGPPVPVPIPVG